MTQPTTQAIQQAREIAAECWNAKGLGLPDDILAGRCDHFFPVQAALRALSVSASEREALEVRVKDLEEFVASFHVTVIPGNVYKDVTLHLDKPHSLSLRLRNDSTKSWLFQDLETRRRAALNGAKP